MKYKQHHKRDLFNSTDSHSLQVNFELILDEAYRFMVRDMNEISIRKGLKALAILEPKG